MNKKTYRDFILKEYRESMHYSAIKADLIWPPLLWVIWGIILIHFIRFFAGQHLIVFQFLSGYLVIQSSLYLRASIQVQLTNWMEWVYFIWALLQNSEHHHKLHTVVESIILFYFNSLNTVNKYQEEIYTVFSCTE